MDDAPVQVQQRYRDMLMSRSPSERLGMASRMYDSGRRLVISGIQNGGQQLTDAQLRGRVFLRVYGSDSAPIEIDRIIRSIPSMQLDAESEPAGPPGD